MRKLTLGFKKSTCQYCENCNTKDMRQGRPYCRKEYKPKNGHCENFKTTRPKVKG